MRVRHDGGEDGISLESLAPHGESPPLHVHHTEDEIFHVLEGRLRVRAADTEVTLGAGETILGPGECRTPTASSRARERAGS